MTNQYVIEENLFKRKIIVNAQQRGWAWSGARWASHAKGVPLGRVQIANYHNEAEADDAAQKAGLEKSQWLK